tara:strand:- start:361 stop:1356 length:996 start_codon:yes stop_codon:yes gene_type:complete
MKIVYKSGGEYSDCIVKHFGLDRYDDGDEDSVFFWGWQALLDEELKERYKNSKHRFAFNTSAPCDLLGHDPNYRGSNTITNQEYFTEIFNICPYTSHWLANNSTTQHTSVCFPFPANKFEKYTNLRPEDKKHDVIYYGQLHHPLYHLMLNVMSQFDFCFSTISTHGLVMRGSEGNIVGDATDKITHRRLPSEEKWDLLSQNKVSIGFNLLFLEQHHIDTFSSFNNIETFPAHEFITQSKIMPQMKTRMVEAAATKTLMLIFKDPFKVVEQWFEPDKHFIYWESFAELHEKLSDITTNYEKYWHIVENAHAHVQQYSIENFMEDLNARLLAR